MQVISISIMSEDQKTPVSATEEGEAKHFKCAKCGKEKSESEGTFVYGGTTFCCENCCKKDGEKADNVCEFC